MATTPVFEILAEEPANRWQTLLEAAYLPQDEDLPPPPVLLALNGSGCFTAGNFSVFSGKPKSRKTFFTTWAIAAAAAGAEVGPFTGMLPPDKPAVLVFDTEQSRWHTQRMQKRTLALMNGRGTENLRWFTLRGLTAPERLELIRFAIENTPGVGLVIVDGIADLAVDPILDAEQSHAVIHLLMSMTDTRGLHIIGVLHLNKTDSNVRGHLGSDACRKAETVLLVERSAENGEQSIVTPTYMRDRDFDPVIFSVNGEGLPTLTTDWAPKPKDVKSRREMGPDDVPQELHEALARKLLSGDPEKKRSHSELLSAMRSEFAQRGHRWGSNKILTVLHYWCRVEFAVKVGRDRTATAGYCLGQLLVDD